MEMLQPQNYKPKAIDNWLKTYYLTINQIRTFKMSTLEIITIVLSVLWLLTVFVFKVRSIWTDISTKTLVILALTGIPIAIMAIIILIMH